MQKNWILFAALFVLNSGCASYFIRKECEQKNWHQHGYDLAMRGVRPANDEYLAKCRKAEAEIGEAQLDRGFKEGMSNYCRPEIARQTGKSGNPMNLDLCDPGQARLLTAKHLEGLKEFCQADNGYAVGASGRVYAKNCPADLETKFLPEYRRGRKKYLQAMVVETQGKAADLDRRIADKDRETRNLQFQIATLPPAQRIVQQNRAADGTYSLNESVTDPHEQRRRQLTWDLDRANNEIKSLQTEQGAVREKMYEYQRELTTLE